jgi:polar amino acid transport system substrate-binding protein
MFLKILVIVLGLGAASSAWSLEKIKVAFGDALAPWVMPDTHDGIILDILTEALKPAGYEIVPIYYPYLRRISEYKNGFVDVVCDININIIEDNNLEGFLSDDAYAYENFAFSLKEKGYQFKHLNELGNLSLLSWQGAISQLGGEYAKMAINNPFYFETDRQEAQIQMLFLKRADVVQLDKQIFNYFRSKVGQKGVIDTTVEVDSFALFGKSPNGFLFSDEKIRDEFNRQLKLLKESGRYEEILNRYSTARHK